MRYVLFAVVALLITASAGASIAQTVLERGNGVEPTTLDPHKATTAAEANILRDLYEGLLTYDAAGALVPGAASGWTISEDRLTYVFTLRAANWSNGTPVTAVDFVASFRRLLDPATAAPDGHLFDSIARARAVLAGNSHPNTIGVRAEDARTFVISLAEEEPLLLHFLARPSAMPIHRRYTAILAMPEVTSPFNGAYRFDGYDPAAEGLWLTRNRAFHDNESVAFDTIVYRSFDRETAVQEFAEGRLDISNSIPAFGLGRIEADYGAELHKTTYSGTFILAANLSGPLADRAIRRAVALAIDRIALAEDIWRGLMIPTLALLPNGIADLGAAATAGLGPNDAAARQAEARQLLEAAGFGPDTPLELTIAIAAGSINREAAESIVEDLAAIGIVASVVERPSVEHNALLTTNRDFDLATMGWIGEFGHPTEYLALFEAGDFDVTGYRNPTFASLVAEARTTSDRTVRTALYQAADRALATDLPAIPLMHYASLNLVSEELFGWIDNPIDVHLSRWLAPTPTE